VIGGQIQLEAATYGDQIDERYMFIERADIGRIEIGSTDRVHGKMLYFAPTVLPGHSTTVHSEYSSAQGNGGAPLMWFANNNHDTEGLNIYTASNRYFGSKAGKGLQLGFSYTPDGCEDFSGNTNGCGGGFGATNDPGQYSKVYTVAANYIESFGPVDVALFGAYMNADIEGDVAATGTAASIVKQSGLEGYAFGTTLTYNVGDGSSIQVGGAYKYEETGSLGSDDRNVYTAGVRYLTNGVAPGSVGIGVDYALTKADQGNVAGTVVGGEDKFTWYSAGVTYQLARGVLTFAGVGYYEYEDHASVAADEADAVFGVAGIRLDF